MGQSGKHMIFVWAGVLGLGVPGHNVPRHVN